MERLTPFVRSFYLGTVRYAKALKLQQNLIQWNKCYPERAYPTLLLLQHHPVYTIGYRDAQYTDEERHFLMSLGADFVKTNRGGLITFHGPGQLVVYPVFSRLHIPIGIRNYVFQLEETIINLCKRYEISADRSPHTGVWVGDKKICAMGINAQRRIYSHGIALNCNTDLLWFSRIVPCGIKDKGVTSLTLQTGRNVSVTEVLPHLVEEMSTEFKWDIAKPKELYANEDVDDDVLFKEISGTSYEEVSDVILEKLRKKG